jgi:hypothetical protein
MKMSFLRVLIVCSLGAIASTTQAGLTHVNDDDFDALVSQEYEITRDSDTNLDWLDIDAYVSLKSAEVTALLGTVGHLLEDWRYADRDEVGVFFGHLGLPIDNYPAQTLSVDGGAAGTAAEAYTGVTAGAPDGHAQGYTSTIASTADRVYVPYHGSDFFSLTQGDFERTIYEANAAGHWLVRVVPEPSTFSMLAFCGIAMAGYTRLRRRRK